jgi:hypothetical protein
MRGSPAAPREALLSKTFSSGCVGVFNFPNSTDRRTSTVSALWLIGEEKRKGVRRKNFAAASGLANEAGHLVTLRMPPHSCLVLSQELPRPYLRQWPAPIRRTHQPGTRSRGADERPRLFAVQPQMQFMNDTSTAHIPPHLARADRRQQGGDPRLTQRRIQRVNAMRLLR